MGIEYKKPKRRKTPYFAIKHNSPLYITKQDGTTETQPRLNATELKKIIQKGQRNKT